MRTIKSITERDGPMWRTHCPMLDGLARALPDMLRTYADPVDADPVNLSPSDAAQIAFELFRLWAESERRISEPAAREILEAGGASATDQDLALVVGLATNMRALGRRLRLSGRPSVRHQLPACGVIESAHCDAMWSDVLVEFKAVRRTLGVRDLRQVLLYGILSWAAAGYRPDSAVLVNPLSGEFVKLPFQQLSFVVSGLPFDELSHDIADYLVGLGVSG